MRKDIHDTLASQFETHDIVGQLHNVPPHEVYEITIDGRRAVYKGNTGPTGAAGVEGRVTAFVGAQTSVPVPETLFVGDEYYIAAWDPNAPTPGTERALTKTWADAAGRGLATLHEETAPLLDGYGQFRPQGDSIAVPESTTWHTAAIASVRRYRPVMERHGHADIADSVVDFLTDNPDCFAGVDGPVCCHGWATPEHITVRDGRVACVVDFEHALAAPGEYDYWRTVLPTFGPETDELQAAFRAGYESVRPLPAGFPRRAPLYKLLNECYYFVSLYVQNQHPPDVTEARAEWFRESVSETLDRLRSS